MSKQQKKIEKKKERERESRNKVLLRREKLQAAAKENSKWEIEERKSHRKTPIRNADLRADEARLQVQHNMQILDVLEQERLEEMYGKPVELIPEKITKCD